MDRVKAAATTKASAGFLLHVLVEVPASITFFVFPSRQLGQPTPHAHAVIRQYALLLLTSIIIAGTFAVRPPDELNGQVAGALALYHLGPFVRSWSRLVHQVQHGQSVIWSEAALYLVVHTVAGTMLAHCCWELYLAGVLDILSP